MARAGHQTGFSLLEMLITIIVLASGLLAIGSMYGAILNANTLSKQRSEAVVLAEKKLEELRGQSYASLVSATDTVTAASSSGSSANYQRSWSVAAASGGLTYKDVGVTVTWTDSKNQSQNIVLSTRISNVSATPVTIP
ncbi:type IV pilus modification PilV family protein [Vogesella indigofera]|uniref:type IV pilus modification PilV family protein n=1 Tax=Vogesella indigofera TaxID=45465 RepID=UPI00234F32CE|nr:prepilin-type N-terminal cleavage/methylation domain-containing protein [Vogesella indigofera]MDC7707402.1 prepilin-type N-terminal cleavage/methylation domain-containing protein [Vogesella indigofera]